MRQQLGHVVSPLLSGAEESTWDLVVFVGTGALGPLGSVQTIMLAVVNVVMQLVFVGIAVFNFTKPDIDEEPSCGSHASPYPATG